MTIDLYYSAGSNQCQAIQMVAVALGVELNLKTINLQAKEQLTPEFIKINPQHTIPTMVDDGFVLWETRAILVYLIEKYGKPNDPLYPSDIKQRATINQRLYFDMGSMYSTFYKVFYSAMITKELVGAEDLAKVDVVFGFLDTFLEGAEFLAGAHLTVADISVFTSVSLYEVTGYDFSKFANVSRWYVKLRKTAPGRDINQAGMEIVRPYLSNLLK